MASISRDLLNAGEQVILETKASPVSKWATGNGGLLVLTDQRLIFLNRKGRAIRVSTDRGNIVSASIGNVFSVFAVIAYLLVFAPLLVVLFFIKTIRITTADGEARRYLIWKSATRKEWLAALSNQGEGS